MANKKDAQRLEAQHLYGLGIKQKDIAKQLRVSDHTIVVWKKKYQWDATITKQEVTQSLKYIGLLLAKEMELNPDSREEISYHHTIIFNALFNAQLI